MEEGEEGCEVNGQCRSCADRPDMITERVWRKILLAVRGGQDGHGLARTSSSDILSARRRSLCALPCSPKHPFLHHRSFSTHSFPARAPPKTSINLSPHAQTFPSVYEETYQQNRTVLFSPVEDPEPHGGSQQLGAPSVLERRLVRCEPGGGSVPS